MPLQIVYVVREVHYPKFLSTLTVWTNSKLARQHVDARIKNHYSHEGEYPEETGPNIITIYSEMGFVTQFVIEPFQVHSELAGGEL